MIMPTIRASFDRRQAHHLIGLLGKDDPELRDAAQRRLEEKGIDSLLDDPRIQNALLTDVRSGASPEILAYVLVRQSLLESGIDDRGTADYIASLLLRFGCGNRAYRISDESDEEFHYLVDIVLRGEEERGGGVGSRGRDRRGSHTFLLHTHLGNYSLWITGLFPDYLEARVQRRGAPALSYYEKMGATGYRRAADTPHAESLRIEGILRGVAEDFSEVRRALNRLADRYLWPDTGNPVNRLLREVADRYR
ncbi:MAG: hypothetical protein R3223_11465 [Longimicrobiales bacterium]|nr:hypothetical protein [Longimicrobiales bacterium]